MKNSRWYVAARYMWCRAFGGPTRWIKRTCWFACALGWFGMWWLFWASEAGRSAATLAEVQVFSREAMALKLWGFASVGVSYVAAIALCVIVNCEDPAYADKWLFTEQKRAEITSWQAGKDGEK